MVGVREARRLSILVDVQDHATAKLAGINGIASKMSNSFRGAGASASVLRSGLLAAAAAAGVAALAISRVTRVGAELDKQFAIIQETSNATAGEMDKIIQKTQQIGAEMPVRLTDVANAFKEFSYAGFSAEEATNAANAAVELAVAGQISMQDAVRTTTAMVNAFNVDASQADQVISDVASTFSNSALNIKEMGDAMQYAAVGMSQAGFEASDTAAAIGTMADQGVRGSMAGTAINQAMSKMISGAGGAQKALEAAGMSLSDLTDEEGNMLPLVEVMRRLKEGAEEANIQGVYFNKWVEDIAGRRGARAMLPLLNNLDSFEKKVENNALASLKTFMQEVEKVDKARMEIAATVDSPEKLEKLRQMSDEEVLNWHARIDAQKVPEDAKKVFEMFRQEARDGDMGQQEIQDRLQAMFQLDESEAAELSEMLVGDKELEEIAKAYEEVNTQTNLAGARAETVGGKMEYLRGSLESIMYGIYRGVRPAVQVLLDVFINFADILNNNQQALRVLGKALGAATIAAFGFATVMGTAWFVSTGIGGAAVAAAGSIMKLSGAMAASIIRTRSLTGATLLLDAALASSTKAMVMQARTAFWAAGGGLSGLAASLKVVTAKAYAAATGMTAFNVTLWPIILGMAAVIAVLWALHTNFMGITDAAKVALDALRGFASGVMSAFNTVMGVVMDVINWFRELNTVGQLLIITALAIVSPWLTVAGALYVLGSVILDTLEYFGLIEAAQQKAAAGSQWLATEFDRLTAGVQRFADAAGPAINKVVNAIVALAAAGGQIYAGLTLALEGLYVMLIDAEEGMNRVRDGLGKVEEALGGWPPILEEAYDYFKEIWDVVEDLEDADIDLVGILEQLGTDFIDWVESQIRQLIDYLVDKLPDWLKPGDGGSDSQQGSGDMTGSEQDSGDIPDTGTTGTAPTGPGAPKFQKMAWFKQSMQQLASAQRASSQQPKMQYMTARPSATAGTSYTQQNLDRGIEYVDQRTVDVSQDPTISIDNSGGGTDPKKIKEAIDRAMEQARAGALDDFIDFLTLGGPGALSGQQGVGGQPNPQSPSQENVQPGTGTGTGSGDGSGSGGGDGSGDGSGGSGDGSGDGSGGGGGSGDGGGGGGGLPDDGTEFV